MMKMKKKKIAIILKNLKKIVKPHQILFIIVMLVGNTYAWFVYSNKVSNSIDVHVRAWNVLFQSGETTISDYFYVNIPNVYPGMTDYVSSLTIENESEIAANIRYEILNLRIFDDEYVTVEGRHENNETVLQTDLTSAQLEQKLLNDYPFTIAFALTSNSISQVTNGTISQSVYSVTLSWPFESGNDALDTYWGKRAYDYAASASPSSPEISLTIKIYVTQSN